MSYNVTTALSDQFGQLPERRYSRYDKPVQFAVTFEGSGYLVYDDQGTLSRKQYNSFLLPLTSLVSFRKSKRRTRILNTTEQYLPSSWIIDIRGLCYHDPARASFQDAHDQKKQLMLWDRIADTIQVSGKGFEDLDISEIEITDMTIGQYQGKEHQVPFAIRAESHIPYEVLTGLNNG